LDPTSPLPALAALLAAFGTAHLLSGKAAPADPARYGTIDGLRGYLAFFVFLHHSCIWYAWTHEGTWAVLPPSQLYLHFGQSGVALFFMITGFLFFTKLLDARSKGKGPDWLRLYVSRFLRLFPLYFLAMGVLFAIVAALSHAHLGEPPYRLLRHALQWLSFTVGGNPDINGIPDTYLITAGVTWSLVYEWYFYLALPLVALALGLRAPLAFLALGTIATVAFVFRPTDWHYLVAFGGGIAAALLAPSPRFRRLATGPLASLVAMACVATAVAFFPKAYWVVPTLLLSVAFALIAGGNTLFGLLLTRASHTLGDMAYGLYLLHGLVLYTLFTFVIGRDTAKGFSPLTHWLVIVALAPLLVLLCHATYRLVEKPSLERTNAVTAWLRALFGRRAAVVPASEAGK
jgi:peptidoglycan/LPS O-acetylase OafA/YrhL